MQSVFKVPLALTALHFVEQGTLSLDGSVRFLATDRILPRTYSPLQDQYPAAEVDIPLHRLLSLAVSQSDNVAADTVLRAIGGLKIVDRYIEASGVVGFHMENNEAALHSDATAQYRNWFEPAGAVQFLRLLNDHPPLTAEHAALILGWMRDSTRGTSVLSSCQMGGAWRLAFSSPTRQPTKLHAIPSSPASLEPLTTQLSRQQMDSMFSRDAERHH